jgi:hypothetical protein
MKKCLGVTQNKVILFDFNNFCKKGEVHNHVGIGNIFNVRHCTLIK